MSDRPFQFFRAGGFDQVHFATGDDLVNLDKLDHKLWVALACPTKGLAFDARTLELIDSDKDGRIRALELSGAASWVGKLLKSPDILLEGPSEVPLSAIDEGSEEGRRVLQAAKAMLRSLGKDTAGALSVADAQAATKAFDALPFNGDGVVTPDSTKDEAARALLTDIIATVGGVADRSGKQGVNVEKATAFFDAIKAHALWLAQAEAEGVPSLKAETAAAYEALIAVRGKIDDYFTRCRLAAFDARSTAALNRDEKEYIALGANDLSASAVELRGFPLAKVEPQAQGQGQLPLEKGLNPAWAKAMAEFRARTVRPLLGEVTALSEAQWATLVDSFRAYEGWLGKKSTTGVEKLEAPRIVTLAAEDARAPIDALLAQEKEQEVTATSMLSVEKLVRCVRDLHRLAINFVSFREFYGRKTPAIFQAGMLYFDQRTCELCIRVDDATRHANMAPSSRVYLAYCDCVRPASGEKLTIAAAFTAGGSDNVMVGRNGVFVDRDGKDWDATITKIVDHPISIRQAFWSPYKKLIRFVEEQLGKRAADADKKSSETLTTSATNLGTAAETGKPAAPPAPPKRFDVGVVAALGVAVGGITAAFGALLQAFFGLGLWMPVGLVGLVLLISGPSMMIALLKLRGRNIGPLLDANGWAINTNARLSVPFGASLTKVAVKPAGSQVDTRDPYEEVRRPWGLYIFLIVLLGAAVGYYFGRLDGLLPQGARSTSVLGPLSPVGPPAAEPAPK